MRLSDRLGRGPAPTHPDGHDGAHEADAAHFSATAPETADAAPSPSTQPRRRDPLAEIKERTQVSLFEVMGESFTGLNLSEQSARREIDSLLGDILATDEVLLTPAERREVVDAVSANLLGLGPIQKLIDDPSITEIMVNAPDLVFIERAGRVEETDVTFYSAAHLRSVIERIVSNVGRRIDESTPMVDARLPDGSRVNAVLPPLTIDSPTLTIRKFSDGAMGTSRLVENGTFTDQVADFLQTCVRGRCNILVSGGTGSGKTTMLNALSSYINATERVITIEDTAELQLQQRHVVRMETRPANAEGRGQVDVRDLVKNALRMRPDRLVVGECRGAEAMDMLQAMNTGHDGSLSTLHANSTRDAVARIETMVLMAGMELPHRAVREQVTSAIDLIVHMSRLADGSRRIVEISEVTGMEGEIIQLTPIFEFDWTAGRDHDGAFLGGLRATGLRPSFSERLDEQGNSFGAFLFAGPDDLP